MVRVKKETVEVMLGFITIQINLDDVLGTLSLPPPYSRTRQSG
jgi:hypothetical protein